jgi:uncharacterized BrkB/YihY/UPF0761 family membrane protein
MSSEDHASTLAQLKDDFTRLPLKDLGKRAYKKIGADQVTTMSGAFAYAWTFSIPPLILLTVLFAALLNEVTNVPVVENMQDAIKKHAPADTQEMLLRMVDNAVAKVGGNTASVGVIVTAILALWAASSAIGVLITGFNRAYDVEEDRSFLKKKGVQLGLTLMLVLFVNAVVALLVFGTMSSAACHPRPIQSCPPCSLRHRFWVLGFRFWGFGTAYRLHFPFHQPTTIHQPPNSAPSRPASRLLDYSTSRLNRSCTVWSEVSPKSE